MQINLGEKCSNRNVIRLNMVSRVRNIVIYYTALTFLGKTKIRLLLDNFGLLQAADDFSSTPPMFLNEYLIYGKITKNPKLGCSLRPGKGLLRTCIMNNEIK